MLEENSVNSICTKNTNLTRNEDKGSFTITPVPHEFLNTKRHFYGTPKIDKLENNNNNNNKEKYRVNNMNLNMDRYIDNLNNFEIKDPDYFNSKLSSSPKNNYNNNNNKLIEIEINENDIINILEKFYKIAKKMGFEIESSLINCFKDKKNSLITNEMISFYLKVRYELDDIELRKILIFYSDYPEDPNCEFRIIYFMELINKFEEDKLKSLKRKNPFENNIYNMNETNFNINSNSKRGTLAETPKVNYNKSPQNKSMYRDESFKMGINEYNKKIYIIILHYIIFFILFYIIFIIYFILFYNLIYYLFYFVL
jgi:hypothetical protein